MRRTPVGSPSTAQQEMTATAGWRRSDGEFRAMAMLEGLITTGRIVDLMLIFVALEVAAMLAYRYGTGRGIPALPMLLNVGAGGSLMLALKATLIGADWKWIAACLIGALCFHTADLVQRWAGAAETGP